LWKQAADLPKAEAAYLEAVKVLPTDDESYTWLAEIHATRGGARDMKASPVPAELDKALEFYEKAASIKPDNPNTYVNQRVILYKYIEHYKKVKADAEAEMQTHEKSKEKDAKEKAEEAKGRVDKAQASIDETNKKIEAVSAKWTAAKEKATAAAAAAAAAPPPSAATKK
jgi:tetratricopeptide (TPR) repeat protein